MAEGSAVPLVIADDWDELEDEERAALHRELAAVTASMLQTASRKSWRLFFLASHATLKCDDHTLRLRSSLFAFGATSARNAHLINIFPLPDADIHSHRHPGPPARALKRRGT